MTLEEKITVTKVREEQIQMAERLKNALETQDEMKEDIKEIKHLLQDMSSRYVEKAVMKWIIGITVSIATLAVFFWDHVTRK